MDDDDVLVGATRGGPRFDDESTHEFRVADLQEFDRHATTKFAVARQIYAFHAAATELTETHLGRFATGKLAEEREALAVAALVRLGERERASRRAERFK